MTTVNVLKAEWAGFSGAPGMSQFVTEGTTDTDLQAALQAIDDFFIALASLIPDNVTITPQTEVLTYEHTTGVLLDATTLTSVGFSTGTGTGVWSAASGGAITWETGTVQNGRRLRGRTFIVPMVSTAYADDGTLTATAVTSMETAAARIVDFVGPVSGAGFSVWGRPRDATETEPAKPASLAGISGVTVNDKVAVLRGRRD